MSIKKKFGMALATTALGAMLIGGGTFALFTDTAENTGNTFTAGTLVIEDVTGGAVFQSPNYNIGGLAPGDFGSGTLTIENKGSLAAFVALDGLAEQSGGLFAEPHGLEITLDTAIKEVAPGGTATFTINWSFPLDADDTYQGETANFDINVKAVQVRNNDVNENGIPDNWE